MSDELKENEVVIAAELPSGRSEKFQTIYANTVRIGLTPWDFRFTFGLIVEGEPKKPINEEQVTVLMSPQHTKAMLNAMVTTMAQWEADNGTLAPTPSVSPSASALSNVTEHDLQRIAVQTTMKNLDMTEEQAIDHLYGDGLTRELVQSLRASPSPEPPDEE